jgi:glycosyltransferase involved in cell wall biosynthesis
MLGFSIIVPSYNQEKFIRETLENLASLKASFAGKANIQLIVVDNCSNENVQQIFKGYASIIDNLIVEKDKGQYDAINKGIDIVQGDYWTWLNTDDLLDIEGFGKTLAYLNTHPETDYIYGEVDYINEKSEVYKSYSSGTITLDKLVNGDASISQPGSFFRTAFTNKIGKLSSYHFAFDYEYILRCLKHNAVVRKLDANVAFFRYYTTSKSGSQDHRFLSEQLKIAKDYGNKPFSKLRFILSIRILKRKLFNA